MTEKKGITVYLDDEILKKFRIKSATEGKSMSKLLSELIEKYLKDIKE